MADSHQHPEGPEPSASDIKLVIAASSAGTIFEWYDFFIYGTLAGLIGAAFFPSDNETLQTLLVWAGFAVGFGFRPLGAILFGFLGDRLGRKYTFLVTVTLMGVATAGVGLIPTAATIGIAAPIIVICFRRSWGCTGSKAGINNRGRNRERRRIGPLGTYVSNVISINA